MPEAEALVEVTGVGTLSDYASVERILGELPGVRRSGLQEAEGTTATFRVLIRGGAEAVQRALSASARFTRTGVANGRLMYQYRP
jgi:selenocysteine lyase/cysteine desulfurase